jgi:hypothetical protein
MSKETNDPKRKIRVFISCTAPDLDHVTFNTVQTEGSRINVPTAKDSLEKWGVFLVPHHGGDPLSEVLNAEYIKPFSNSSSPDDGIDLILVDGVDLFIDLRSSITSQYGERLLHFMLSEEEHENLIGDLAEEYAELNAKYGSQLAKAWYRQQIRISLFSIFSEMVCKKLFARAIEWFRKIT